MKHPFTLARSRTGLIVVDMQEKFAPVIPEFDTLVLNATKLILAFQLFKIPVLVSEQYPKGLGPTVDTIKRQFSSFDPVEKVEFACTESSPFWSRLSALDLETIVVTGVETHVCINQTVLGLIQRGYRVHVVADAVGSRSRFDHDIALGKMQQAGALIASTEMALFELAHCAGTPEFKYIQKMVKAAPASEHDPRKKDGTRHITSHGGSSEGAKGQATFEGRSPEVDKKRSESDVEELVVSSTESAGKEDDVLDLEHLLTQESEKKTTQIPLQAEPKKKITE